MICPIGGERFSTWQPSVYSTYGQRPDGKPYSYLPLPFPVPECPSNKLVVFGHFNAEEIAVLTQMVAGAEYKRLIVSENAYYRAYWLATKLGRPEPEALGLLLSAIWEASPGVMWAPDAANSATQLRLYQQQFVNRARRLDYRVSLKDRLWIEARAANAARQLSHFGEAQALHKRTVSTLEKIRAKEGWDKYLALLKRVIDRRDDSIEPLDMIPESQIAFACLYRKPANEFDRAACAKPEVSALVAELRKSKE